jgi:PAS domain S-box-containing protein
LVIWGGALAPHLDAEETRAFYARYHPLPVVSLAYTLPGIPSVIGDNYQGMRNAIIHLIEAHDYRRIAFMRGPEIGVEAEERYRAYVDVLREYNLPRDPDLILFGNNEAPPAAAAMRRLLEERKLYPHTDFEAVVASNDVMALAVLEVLQKCGIRVHQDVALVGFDDLGQARAVTPPLTTVRYSFEKLGREAVKLLLAMLKEKDVPDQVMVPLEVVVRQSCGCADTSIMQAAVDPEIVINAPRLAETPVASWRGQLLAAMRQTLVAEEDVAGWIEQVLDAFLDELQGVSPGRFLAVLQEVLQQVSFAERDVEIWQNIISALRYQIMSYLPEEALRVYVENLCQQARVVIGQTARRVQEFKRLQSAQQEQTLREIGARLITTFEVEALMDILAEELPRLDILACYLALYEDPQPYAYPQSAPEWSQLMLAYDDQRRISLEPNGRRFSSCHLVPEDVLPQVKRYDMVVMPLYFREYQIGFVLFEATPREGIIYHALRTEISSALQGALLVQRVQEHAAEITRQKYVLDTFMATVPDAIYFKDLNSCITHANQAHARYRGFDDPSEEIGKTDFDFFPEKQAQIKYVQEQEIIRTGQPLLELEEADAQGRWVLTTKMPLRDEHGEIIGTFGISRDITTLKHTEQELMRYRDHLADLVKERTAELTRINTRLNDEIIERMRAEEAWRAGEKQYRMLAEHVKDGIIIVQGGKLVFVNTAFVEMVGYSGDHLLQIDPVSLFPDHARQRISEHLIQEEAEGANPAWQVELKTEDGRTIWTEIEESPIIWNAQFALLLTIRNIHQTKLREIRMEEERTRLRQENLTYRSANTERYRFGPLVGKSLAMQRVYELIVSAATSGVNVLVYGESGTGKELIAQTIHQVSPRKEHPFVAVNCASIPETLFEREFFGHRKGAFTGADRDKPGLFDRAHRGVLFLDEISELSPGMQAKLLRVLQDGEYLPLGSNTANQADVKIVAATNKECREEIEHGRLRQDFFYRIGVIEIAVPPLRERRDDLPLLIEHILEQYCQKQSAMHGSVPQDLPIDQTMLPGALVQGLYAYHWPGNVRELQNVLQRYLATRDLNAISSLLGISTRSHSMLETSIASDNLTLPEAVRIFEKQIIADLWERNYYHTAKTARMLGIPRRTLAYKIKQYQLKKPQ